MRVTAFAGPSLRSTERAGYRDIEWRPPAEAGDLLRLAADPPDTICLIDGYFDHRPAVRHKEILMLLAAGVRIYGASSIGALRAAEMDGFGMIGVGAIYAAYHDGLIDGDDEVALLHAPAELDWQPLSLPLVDARATLDAARIAGIICAREQQQLITAAANIFYQERDWAGVFARAAWPAADTRRLIAWLNANAVSQKCLDAHACVAAAITGDADMRARPAAVMPGFVESLARDCGLTLASALPGAATISARAAPCPETDAGI